MATQSELLERLVDAIEKIAHEGLEIYINIERDTAPIDVILTKNPPPPTP